MKSSVEQFAEDREVALVQAGDEALKESAVVDRQLILLSVRCPRHDMKPLSPQQSVHGGAVLERIPAGRGYVPAPRKPDAGLSMADIGTGKKPIAQLR
jgi:hypothetical protein